MSKFAIGEKVDNAADDHEGGTVIAVVRSLASSAGTRPNNGSRMRRESHVSDD
jgi:hypothetical protein